MPDSHSGPPPCSASSQAAAVWRIEGPLVIATVADWHRRTREQLAATPALAVDLAGMTAVDVFGLQLLWAACRSSTTVHVALVNPPAVFASACLANGFNFDLSSP